MNILFAASEAVPLAKTGGLADVTGSLPRALNTSGADVRVIIPNYEEIPEHYKKSFKTLRTFTVRLGWRKQYCGLMEAKIDGIHYYFIDNEYYFKRGTLYGYDDEAERFVFFCFAVLESIPYLGFTPDIIHCHDWQTGLIPFLLKTRYLHTPKLQDLHTVYTIHNLKYQGVFSQELLRDLLSIGPELFSADGLEFFGGGSCMKAGLLFADKLTTVSETYAIEIQSENYGEKLEGVLRKRSSDIHGIVNGIDQNSFDPMNDECIPHPFRNSLTKKVQNKLALQRELGLPEDKDIPLIGIVTRLVEQKGLDLIEYNIHSLMNKPLQLVVLGSGEYRYEELFRRTQSKHPNKLAIYFGFNDGLARRIYAGSDMYLMPSRFEPCGLSQLIALRYRSVPIVRETGGLKDTIQPFNEYTGKGNGFSFTHYNAHDLLYTIERALTFYEDQTTWEAIVGNLAKSNFSWSRSARRYMEVYNEIRSHREEEI
jgi:starch synthase